MPEVEVGVYSFTYDGYNYMSIGLSENESEDSHLVATRELIGFNNELIKFITKDAAE